VARIQLEGDEVALALAFSGDDETLIVGTTDGFVRRFSAHAGNR
jgi:hypothetical protein